MEPTAQQHVWPSNERTRYKPGECPNPGGRPSVKWLKELIEVVDPETGKTKRVCIAEHLIEVATSWSVKQFGRDIEIASAADSVKAAALLFGYCYGKPPPSVEEQTLSLAEHFRQVARDSVDLALKVLGDRIQGMKPEEIAEGLKAFSVNPRGFLDAAEERVAMRGNGSSPAQQLAPAEKGVEVSET